MAKWIDLEWITTAIKAAGGALSTFRIYDDGSAAVFNEKNGAINETRSNDYDGLLRLLGKQPPKILDVAALQNLLAGRWLLVAPDGSYAMLRKCPPVIHAGIEAVGSIEDLVKQLTSGRPAEPMDEADRELAEWVESHYVNVGLIRDEDGQLRPITNREMSAWREWKRAKNDRPID